MRPHALKGFRVSVAAVSYRFGPYNDVLPMIRSEPFEEGAECWHAGGDQSEVVLDAAAELDQDHLGKVGREDYSQQGHDAVLRKGGIGRSSRLDRKSDTDRAGYRGTDVRISVPARGFGF